MHKADKWEGKTQNPPHGFDVEFYKDITAGEFVAKIKIWSQMWRVYSNTLQEHYEELRDDDLTELPPAFSWWVQKLSAD